MEIIFKKWNNKKKYRLLKVSVNGPKDILKWKNMCSRKFIKFQYEKQASRTPNHASTWIEKVQPPEL